jgi:hypothetical protein
MFRNKISRVFGLSAIALGLSWQADALPTVGTSGQKKAILKTAAGCNPATAVIDLDINNVRARLMTGGDMWWNQGISQAAYEIPKGSKKNSLFAGSVWVGGFTTDKVLKVCAQTYRSQGNDYWPGPLHDNNGTHSISAEVCADWDRFWKIDRETINKFKELSRNGGNTNTSEFDAIWEWPARGNGVGVEQNASSKKALGTSGLPLFMDARDYAPFVNSNNPNGKAELYEPEYGDVPGDPKIEDLLGDQYIWWVFNDRGNVKGQTKTESIGMEVQTGAFAFATKDFMNDATFYNYKLLNWSTSNLDSTYMATWTDADLGYAFDDYIGCDTVRGLGILYNGDGNDGAGEATSYGSNLPMVGVDFFRGPHKIYIDSAGKEQDTLMKMSAFTYFNNSADPRIGDPTNGVQTYFYMTGSSRNGQDFLNDFQGAGVPSTALNPGFDTRFVFFGDPDKNEWSECNCQNPPDDRRFIHSAGPFTLVPGQINDVTIGAIWVSGTGGCPNTSFKKIRLADDQAQELFDNNFKTIEGPEAPNMVKREMDKRIIFYLTNPNFSTNFQEKYGYQIDTPKYRVLSLKAKNAKSADTLYKFEGYRVFQLKSQQITPAQVFGENGEVNNQVAIEVFQCDIQNGISQLVNWQKNINIQSCDSCYTPVVKVTGRDSGIVHSFEVTQDAFATGTNKSLVNYKTYYFVAIAYARNNFANFDPSKPEVTQDIVYMESAHGPGGTAIKVVEAMPNPFSNAVGTEINAGYGDGVIIKRIEGIGNGGNDIQITAESENQALQATSNYQSTQPTYKPNQGPVNVKVIDPINVPAGNWSLYIRPDTTKPGTRVEFDGRLVASKAEWILVKDNQDTIFRERNIDVLNEQIVQKYGLSVGIQQVQRPGENQPGNNGYITSDIVFSNPSLAWLAGVNDAENTDPQNWIRSGGHAEPATPAPPCNYNDNAYDTFQRYEAMLNGNSFTIGTWAPYSLGAVEDKASCGFGIAKSGTVRVLYDLQSVDVVFTNDRNKWSRCVVIETTDDPALAQNQAPKFTMRRHASWTGDVDGDGSPVYSTTDSGFSYFPGYAINQETGERLNIIFGEDSYLRNHNGQDMLWNPTSTVIDEAGNSIFGGRHYVYISKLKYDGGDTIATLLNKGVVFVNQAYNSIMWAGMPTVNTGFSLLSPKDGLIPTETRLRFRVTRPYGRYIPAGVDTTAVGSNKGFPWYTFNTDGLATKALSDAGNKYQNNKQALLDKINVVPNPYYAYAGYEAGRLDTRVRIVNLPSKATISVYSVDGALIRRLDKDNNVSYIDWDIRNAKGLPIASGMYLIHVKAENIGETIVRWFGAMRPIDITQY